MNDISICGLAAIIPLSRDAQRTVDQYILVLPTP